MFLVVRTKDRLKETVRELTLSCKGNEFHPFAVSRINVTPLKNIKEDLFDAVVITSPSGALGVPRTKLPFFCVGAKTADEATILGHRVVYEGVGGVQELIEHIHTRYPAQNLLYAHGDTADTSWLKTLSTYGFKGKAYPVYKTEYATEFDKETLELLKNGKIKHVLFFSENGCTEFKKIAKKAGQPLSSITALVFSEAIAKVAEGFLNVHVCKTPTLQAMALLVKQV